MLIEGKYFYKASVIRQVLNTSSLSASKDRLRRVRGVSKYADDKSVDIDIEDMIILGDRLIFTVGSSVKLGSVKDIQRGGKKVKYIPGSALQDENVIVNLLELDLEDDGAEMKWQGNHKDSFKIERKFCNSVQPEIKIEGDKPIYILNNSLIMDIGIQTQSNVNVCTKSATDIPMKRCFVCGYQLSLQKMRTHWLA